MKKIFLLLVLFSLSGCGEGLKTSHTYRQPLSEAGKLCVNRCAESRTECQTLCKGRECGHCSADYRACFELCGGSVSSQRRSLFRGQS